MYLSDNKTIYACATAPGKAGVAVIRISGNHALEALKQFGVKKTVKAREAIVTNIYDPSDGQLIDYILLLYFQSPHSFTGEDVIELHTHGSIAVIRHILAILSNIENFRLAEAGEFAKRAFLNGKMDLTQAEGLADLIEAETIMQAKQASRQMSGQLEKLYNKWREELIELLAIMEAFIDFPEEDIPEELAHHVEEKLKELKESLSQHLNDNKRGERLRQGVYVAIIGAPNVGKSSLLNFLAKKDVAIVSNIAGTTRDIVELHLDLAGMPMTIADTAGLRVSEDIIEQEGIRRAKARAEEADIILTILDASQKPDAESLKYSQMPNSITILNKIDLAKTDLPGLAISIKEGKGLDALIDLLTKKAEEMLNPSFDPIITRERHRKLLQNCLDNLMMFSLDKPIELAVEDLRIAARELGKIVGLIDIETILGSIFSKFCIGK